MPIDRYLCHMSILDFASIYLPIPPHEQDATQDLFFKQSSTGLKSEFSFS